MGGAGTVPRRRWGAGPGACGTPSLTRYPGGASVTAVFEDTGFPKKGVAMNGADIAIALILVIGLFSGLAKGFVRGLFGLVALVLGVMIAASVHERVAESVLSFMPGDHAPQVFSFVLIFLVVVLAVGMLGRIISKALKLAALGWLDRLVGAGLGVVMGSIVAAILLLVAVMAGLGGERTLQRSTLARRVLRLTDIIVSLVPEDARSHFEEPYEELREEWEKAGDREEARERV